MIRSSLRSTRLLNWRYLRWALAIPSLPLVWWACASHPLTQPTPETEQQTNIYINVSPVRQLDLVFMIDNSPSMKPKQDKLKAQFLKLIAALNDPVLGLPDLRVAIIDSDLGTGGAYLSGSSCGPNAENGNSNWGDGGRFMMPNAQGCGVNDPNAKFLSYTSGKPDNFTGDINAVFTCLAGGLGTNGCGEEHQLQAFEFALVAKGVGNDQQQTDFLRDQAYLGLVFLSDEDDCSAATDDGMFGAGPNSAPLYTPADDLSKESPSLRCSTRAHQCGGQNMTVAPPGYPTTAAYSHDFNDCSARTDACPNPTDGTGTTDTSKPTTCSPLKDFKRLANEIKSLKSLPDQQILVAGIFGWPRKGQQPLPYKIDLAINPSNPTGPQWYDYWPVCYDPGYYSDADLTTYNPTDVGYSATGGLRESAFIDEFNQNGNTNGLKFSICETDFTDAMNGIGAAIARRLQYLCIDYKLLNTDLTKAGVTPDCRVAYRHPPVPPAVTWNEDPKGLPQCDPSFSPTNLPPDSFGDCWFIDKNTLNCPNAPGGQFINILRTATNQAAGPLTAGTQAGMQCRTCGDNIPGLDIESVEYVQCNYCSTNADCTDPAHPNCAASQKYPNQMICQ